VSVDQNAETQDLTITNLVKECLKEKGSLFRKELDGKYYCNLLTLDSSRYCFFCTTLEKVVRYDSVKGGSDVFPVCLKEPVSDDPSLEMLRDMGYSVEGENGE